MCVIRSYRYNAKLGEAKELIWLVVIETVNTHEAILPSVVPAHFCQTKTEKAGMPFVFYGERKKKRKKRTLDIGLDIIPQSLISLDIPLLLWGLNY